MAFPVILQLLRESFLNSSYKPDSNSLGLKLLKITQDSNNQALRVSLTGADKHIEFNVRAPILDKITI